MLVDNRVFATQNTLHSMIAARNYIQKIKIDTLQGLIHYRVQTLWRRLPSISGSGKLQQTSQFSKKMWDCKNKSTQHIWLCQSKVNMDKQCRLQPVYFSLWQICLYEGNRLGYKPDCLPWSDLWSCKAHQLNHVVCLPLSI